MRNNVEALGLGGVTKVYRRDATDLGPAHPVEPFSLAFLDPPYGKGLAEKALASLRDGGWLTPGALVVVEEAKAAAFVAPDGFEELERRAYDDTEFVFLAGCPLKLGKAGLKRSVRHGIWLIHYGSIWNRPGRPSQPVPMPTNVAQAGYRRPNSFSISDSFNST